MVRKQLTARVAEEAALDCKMVLNSAQRTEDRSYVAAFFELSSHNTDISFRQEVSIN